MYSTLLLALLFGCVVYASATQPSTAWEAPFCKKKSKSLYPTQYLYEKREEFIPLINGSGSGSRRPKNMRIRIRISNTALKSLDRTGTILITQVLISLHCDRSLARGGTTTTTRGRRGVARATAPRGWSQTSLSARHSLSSSQTRWVTISKNCNTKTTFILVDKKAWLLESATIRYST